MLAIKSINPDAIQNVLVPFKPKNSSKCTRITDIIQRFLVSNTIKLGVISAVIAGAVVILALSHVVVITVVAAVITGVALLALGLHIVVNKKKMMYETTLFVALVLKTFIPSKFSWWHPVTSQLILGAIPLKNFAHDEKIAKKLQIKAVLSLVEDFELRTKGLLTVPCEPFDWRKLGVKHLALPAIDLKPVPLELLEKGVDFLEGHIDKGESCYVHCKAGISRSATLVIAYLLKKKLVKSIDEGIVYLKKRRPFIYISSKRILELYFQKHCIKN